MRAESELADFCVGIRADAIPEEARRRAVDAMTDCAACAVAGTTKPRMIPSAQLHLFQILERFLVESMPPHFSV